MSIKDPTGEFEPNVVATDLPAAVGINHVALTVKDLDLTLNFLSGIFRFALRAREDGHAFIELGDQFIALFEAPDGSVDKQRHFGLVVSDAEKVRARLKAMDVPIVSDRFLEFHDPSGNLWQVVDYANVEFMKREAVLRFLGLERLTKSLDAVEALGDKGISP